jgi:hypothetical protein
VINEILKRIGILLCSIIMYGCGGSSDSGSRSFYMGFTPWPYAATIPAVDNVYTFINREGDLVAHHFQQGIPFTAIDIADFSTYHANVQAEINSRTSKTASGKVIYLAIDSLNGARNDLTDLWAVDGNMTRTGTAWEGLGFNNASVQAAYVDFSKVVIEKFRTQYGKVPEYFNYGTEISELMLNEPLKYNTEYVPFAHYVYDELKVAYPSMKLMVSIALKEPGSAQMNTVTTEFADIRDYVDVVGISTYGYAFYDHADKGNPDTNLSVPFYSLDVNGSEAYQKRYLQKLFSECNSLDAEFIVWFTSYDYDTLWTVTLGSDPLSHIWKDTGLVDDGLVERPALSEWRSWLDRSR